MDVVQELLPTGTDIANPGSGQIVDSVLYTDKSNQTWAFRFSFSHYVTPGGDSFI